MVYALRAMASPSVATYETGLFREKETTKMKKRSITSLSLIFVLMFSVFSPAAAFALSNTDDRGPSSQASQSTWTVLVYIAADNNLEDAGIEDFLELAQNGSTANVNYVVMLDRSDGYDDTYGDWTDAKYFLVTKGLKPLAENALADLGEANMGDVQTLKDFIQYGIANYPAQKYSLILWNHGGGFLPTSVEVQKGADVSDEQRMSIASGGISANGVSWDDTNDEDYLSDLEVQEAAAYMAGLIGKRIDLFGFDACLMAMMEVDYAIKDYASYRVSSAANEPGDGWDYATLSKNLNKNYKKWDGKALAADIVKAYAKVYKNDGSVTLSAVAFGAGYENMLSSFNTLVNLMKANLPAESSAIYKAFNVPSMPIYDDYSYYDVGYMMTQYSKTTKNSAIKKAALAFVKNAKKVVIANKFGKDWKGSTGMSVYYPYGESDWAYERDNYLNLQPFSETLWDEFWDVYFSYNVW